MLPTTLEAVKAVLKADPTVSTADRAQIVTVVRSNGYTGKPTGSASEGRSARLLTRAEVGKRFCRSLRFVDKLAAQGVLHRVTMPGRVRACGFREDEVNKILSGEVL